MDGSACTANKEDLTSLGDFSDNSIREEMRSESSDEKTGGILSEGVSDAATVDIDAVSHLRFLSASVLWESNNLEDGKASLREPRNKAMLGGIRTDVIIGVCDSELMAINCEMTPSRYRYVKYEKLKTK